MKKFIVLFVGISLMFVGCKKKKEDEKKVENKPVKKVAMKKAPVKKAPVKKVPVKKAPVKTVAKIVEEKAPAQKYIKVEFKTSEKKMKEDIGKAFGILGKTLGKAARVGAPMVCFYNEDMKKLEGEAFFAVKDKIKTAGKVKFKEMKEQKIVSMMHVGPYEKVGVVIKALHAYMKTKKLASTGSLCQIFLNDPSKTKPADLKTKVFFVLK